MESEPDGGEEYDNLIRSIKMVLKFIAVWPLEKDCAFSKVIFRICHLSFVLLLLLSTCIVLTADVIYHLNDLDAMTESALMVSAFYLTVIRVVVYSLHQKDLLYIVETMRQDWASSYENKIIIKEKCNFAFLLARYFLVTVIATVLFFSCIPILEVYLLGAQEKILPFRGYYFTNQTISPVYEYLYVVNVMAGIFGGSTIIGMTGLNLIMITHGSAKFAVLRERLKAMSNDDPNADRIMVDCIKSHQDAIIFADVLERVINILALGQFVVSTGLVCFAGFQITSMMEDKGRLMKYSSFLNSAILELFMFSFSGNKLIDESDAVSESAYNSDWMGSTFARSLQIVMMRSKVPSRITAAKFYSMSLESFAQVLSTSFSYMMVLTAANDE